LYDEWQQNWNDDIFRRDIRRVSNSPVSFSAFASRGQAGGGEDLVANAMIEADRDRRVVEDQDDALATASAMKRMGTYRKGIKVAVSGVALQILANMIGAYAAAAVG
jgi:hypothetical protein